VVKMLKQVTSDTFDSEISTGLVLVDFYGTFCNPCKMLAPIIDQISNEYTSVKFIKVDVEESPEIAQAYGIMGVPTLLLFKDGEIVEQSTGFKSRQDIVKMLEKYL
jgi:thioredoxin 1